MPHEYPNIGSSYYGIFRFSGSGPAGTVPNGSTWDCPVVVDPAITTFALGTGVPFILAQAPAIQVAGVTVIAAFISGVGQVSVRWYDISGGESASLPAAGYEFLMVV